MTNEFSFKNIMQIYQNLILLIEYENCELNKMTFINVNIDEKNRKLQLLEKVVTYIKSNPEVVRKFSKTEIETLVLLQGKLDELTKINMYLLDRAILVNSKLIEIFTNSILNSNKNKLHYSTEGKFELSKLPPLAVHENI